MRTWLANVLLLILLICLYIPALPGDFVGDDLARIHTNPEFASLEETVTGQLGDRPVLMFSLWMDYTLFGKRPIPMRLVNLGLHFLVFLELLRLLRLLGRSTDKSLPWATWAVMALFVVHPLATQPITHIVQRGVLIAALAGLASWRHFHLWETCGRRVDWSLSLLFFLLSVLAKPITAALPIFIAFAGWHLHRKNWRPLALIPHMACLTAPLLFQVIFEVNPQSNALAPTPLKYFLLQGEVLFTYLRLMIAPLGLRFFYDFAPNVDSWANPRWLLLGLHALILVWAWKRLPTKEAKVSFVGGYMAFLPESSFFPITHPAFDHRAYFPLAFFSLAGALALPQDPKRPRALAVLMIVFALFFAGATIFRNVQVNTLKKWISHTMDGTRMWPETWFNVVFPLYRTGRTDEADHLVAEFKAHYPHMPVLAAYMAKLRAYYHAPSRDTLRRLSEAMHSDMPKNTEFSRMMNIIVLTGTAEHFEPGTADCFLEEHFGRQLRYARSKAAPDEARAILERYRRHALTCLKSSKMTGKVDEFTRMKIRTILRHYFNAPDPELLADLESGGQGPEWDYLKELAAKEPLPPLGE